MAVLMQPPGSAEADRPWRVLFEGAEPVQFESLRDAFQLQVILQHGVDGPRRSRLEWHHPKTGWQPFPY